MINEFPLPGRIRISRELPRESPEIKAPKIYQYIREFILPSDPEDSPPSSPSSLASFTLEEEYGEIANSSIKYDHIETFLWLIPMMLLLWMMINNR